MPLLAVFLDVGRTLLTEKPSRFEIYAQSARRRGFEVDADTMKAEMRAAHALLPRELEDGSFRYSDPWFQAYIRRIFHERLGLPRDDVEAITEELFMRFEDAGTFQLYPGALELLDLLREHEMVLGVISNWSARLPRVLEAMGVAKRFDFVLCSALERMEKPEPALFQAALARAGVDASEALHAGDHPEKDVRAALTVGIEGVLVDHHGETSAVDGAVRVTGLTELAGVILERVG